MILVSKLGKSAKKGKAAKKRKTAKSRKKEKRGKNRIEGVYFPNICWLYAYIIRFRFQVLKAIFEKKT